MVGLLAAKMVAWLDTVSESELAGYWVGVLAENWVEQLADEMVAKWVVA